MAWASLLGGMALANAALGAVHGFAAPIGGMFPAPHGAVCAALLPHAMEVNVRAVRSRAPEKLIRYDEVARLITGRPHATAPDGVAWISALCQRLEIPPLRTYGVEERHLAALVDKAAQASSMKGNPIVLSGEELREIISLSL
jgi:alcohol dehydrogenase class IV